MRWLGFVGLLLMGCLGGFAQEEDTVTERLDTLEEQRGLLTKKGRRAGGFVIGGELLYWKADVDGTPYATTFEEEGGVETNWKTRTPHFSYDPGFRVALGYAAPYDLFDVEFIWTQFNTQGTDSVNGGERIIFDGIGLIEPLLSTPSKASAKCSVNNDLLDVQFARGVEISSKFYVRPYFGVRGMWSHFDWNIAAGRPLVAVSSSVQDAMRMKVKNSYLAAGGLVGLEMDWRLPKGFGIYTRGNASLVYGKMAEDTRERYRQLPAFSSTVMEQTFKAHNAFLTMKGQWDLFIGLFWQTHSLRSKHFIRAPKQKRRVHVRVFAGFEIQQWPYIAQKTIDQPTRERERYSVGFQGFTGGAFVEF